MSYTELFKIIDELSYINPKKARKLSKIVKERITTKDNKKIKELDSKIWRYVHYIFMQSIDKNSRRELYNLTACIMDDILYVEGQSKGWFISSTGARKYAVADDELVVTNYIPRSYKEGFYLNEDDDPTVLEENMLFLTKNSALLSTISKQMDRKEEILTNEYRPVNINVTRDFTEELIDYLDLPRINKIEEKVSKK